MAALRQPDDDSRLARAPVQVVVLHHMQQVRHQRLHATGHNGVALVADAYGEPGSPGVLLLHGGGQTRHSWGGTATALAREGFFAVSADSRGHGESDWDPFGDYGLEAMQIDTEAWCEQLHQPAIVGASMGGLTGIWTEGTRAAEGRPPASRALVLVDIAHRSEEAGIQRILDFMTGTPEGFASVEEAADAVARYMPHRPRPTRLDGLRKNLRQTPDGRYHWHWDPAFMRAGSRPRPNTHAHVFEEHCRRITVPILLVRGRMSDVVSEDVVQEFLQIVPTARYVDVGDAHHMVAGDRNDAFTAPVVEFLRSL